MDDLERRIEEAEKQIKFLTTELAEQANTIKQLTTTVEPLTSKRAAKNFVANAMHEIQRTR